MKRLLMAAGMYVQDMLACWNRGPLELLFGAMLKAPMILDVRSRDNQFAGRTTLASGSTLVTVSTRMVNSDSLVFALAQHTTVSTQANICVRTISSSNFFNVGWSDGVARAFDSTVMWEIRKGS